MYVEQFILRRKVHIHLIMRKFKDNVKSLRKATSSCSESPGQKITSSVSLASQPSYPKLNSEAYGTRGFWFRFQLKTYKVTIMYPDLMVTILLCAHVSSYLSPIRVYLY